MRIDIDDDLLAMAATGLATMQAAGPAPVIVVDSSIRIALPRDDQAFRPLD